MIKAINLLKTGMFVCILGASALMVGCEQKGPAEKVGESIDNAAEEAKDAAKDAADAVKDAAE